MCAASLCHAATTSPFHSFVMHSTAYWDRSQTPPNWDRTGTTQRRGMYISCSGGAASGSLLCFPRVVYAELDCHDRLRLCHALPCSACLTQATCNMRLASFTFTGTLGSSPRGAGALEGAGDWSGLTDWPCLRQMQRCCNNLHVLRRHSARGRY